MDQHILVIVIIIAFMLYRRVRRNIGWQPLNQGRLMFRIVLFIIIGALFLSEGILHPVSLISDVVGLVLGGILAFYSVNLTVFEQREGRLFYRPNIWIGSIVTALFIIRFIYRFYTMFTSGMVSGVQQGQTNGWQSMYSGSNSWTAGLMLIMFAYYAIYYMILIRKQKQLPDMNVNET
ncbi:DUF1453 family protein [Bacillus sp. BRMEA1]|uniref:CcdC protein domain-containing protein n=1 Tax=Neobacillus endophyticus TaxID=2738405 RepID=UPI001567A3B5|nr:CcdC protein domain-containing protein [Neobacillus endophyticus]NRD78165.1 DUF1453 family protein [Neobacillus endophyticus]